ncbi:MULTISPECIES: TonB-dependent receptor plug domain-containing protein [unclassified Undibacterium]|uniref:TonB-dependent receptor plug domain-containing protein n=1 Tax=unclassified Undibacterium TaxID=2630295 RepID=UPI002AC90FB7|nr:MULTISPECIES: TonB-dependent receptor [unclassified Undibacterium]MEB0140939.1 TonB-dependent receptor [Undibacterium sp. CCC2.1]MEB0173144.1 TonB-dependent receptor [Undibacterium sp. CCC1.1]MEB0177866.1 TonB-dependent receptor [Undibacterium sp. CCC3.4]MEB0216149.1 TonB-dependent receptor [Undibacterium sp. 5I2]WPX42802.1 TonB-dependent receptor [Undibacterium sp. CCC3.4]
MPISSRFSPVFIAVLAVTMSGVDAQVLTPAENKRSDSVGSEFKPLKKTPPVEIEAVQKVVIDGGRNEDDVRRQSTAAKMIFGREELDRNGDTNLADVLKRLPGVSIGGRAGRGGDIRMRGMGNGYTQILINGERAPRGFSMDSLTPDQVERIEIIRGAVAEFSAQAIAGTINIVLREEYKQKNTDLKLSLAAEQDRLAPNVSLTYPGEIGSLSYTLSASLFQNRQADTGTTDSHETGSDGATTLIQKESDQSRRRSSGGNFTPRFKYTFSNGDALTVQPFLMSSRSNSDGSSQVDQIYRSPSLVTLPPYAFAANSGSTESTFFRLFGDWQHKFDDNGKLVVKFGGGYGQNDSASLSNQYDGAGKLQNVVSVNNHTRDQSLKNGGKYSLPIGSGQTFAAGWDAEIGRRTESSISLNNGRPQFDDSGDDLSASTRRLALFVQDEFDINAQFSAYAGLRWEGIATTSSLSNGQAIDNRSRVLSPILHGVWRLSEASKDQIRLSYATTYRAPTLNDLIAVPSISNLNSPTRPDRTGNPLLKPELSKGIDLAFEHYLTRSGLISANLFVRQIDDLMRRTTQLVASASGPRWVSTPLNIGSATTKGIELEAKFQLQEFFPEGPAIDVRSNYSRFWSNVDDIPGPNNKIDQQPGQLANFGLDYRPRGLPLTVGANLNWTPAYQTQSSLTQLSSTGRKRQLDVYGLWRISPSLQVRLSANNLRPDEAVSSSEVNLGGIDHLDNVFSQTYTTYNLRVEMKL